MFSTSKEMIASTPGSGGGMVRVQLRTCLCASALILAGLAVVDPALARSPYDGGVERDGDDARRRLRTHVALRRADFQRSGHGRRRRGGRARTSLTRRGSQRRCAGRRPIGQRLRPPEPRARQRRLARSRQRRRLPRHMGGTAHRRRYPSPSRVARKADLQLCSPLLRAPLHRARLLSTSAPWWRVLSRSAGGRLRSS
jgi:hypothetical protein